MFRHRRPAYQPTPALPVALIGGILLALGGLNLLLARRAARQNPPEGKFIEIDGTSVHYVMLGEGPPLVILHGNGSMVADFLASDLVTRLAETHTVYLFDRPGYGHTAGGFGWWTAQAQARLLDSALKRLGIADEVVLAHSWATLVALSLTQIRPVRGLVLLSGYYFPSVRLDVLGGALPASPGIGDVWRWTVGPLISRLLIGPALRVLFSPARIPDRFNNLFPRGLAVRPMSLKSSATESVLMIPTAYAFTGAYRSITLPVVVVAGEDDAIVSPDQAVRLSDILPNVSLVIVPGAGHMVHHTNPAEVLSAVKTLQGLTKTP